MNNANDLLRVCSLSSHYTLMISLSLFEYFKDYDLCQFEFSSGQYFIFKNDVLSVYLFIDLKNNRSFWTRSMNDVCDVLDSYGFSSLIELHPELSHDSVIGLILDPQELIDTSMSLVNIVYSKGSITNRVNKFIKEFGYEPIVWEVKE